MTASPLPQLSPRRFLFTFLGIFGVFVLLVCAAVTATDPHRYFFGSPVPQIWPNTPRTKIELFRAYSAHENVTGLLLGSSRNALLFPEQADRATHLRFFNASVFDASTDHYLAIYRLFRKMQSAPPKMLILGMETVLLSPHTVIAEDLTANYPLSSQLDARLTLPWHFARLYGHFLRMQTFFDLGSSLRNWMSPQPTLYVYFPDGHQERRAAPGHPLKETRLAPMGHRMEPILAKYREFDGISELGLGRLRTLLTEASADGVHIVLWLTPVHPEMRAAIDKMPAPAAVELHARQVIQGIASEFHADFVDLSAPESFGGDPNFWIDAVHVSSTDARRELDAVLGAVKTDGR